MIPLKEQYNNKNELKVCPLKTYYHCWILNMKLVAININRKTLW
jgi:hypothetical protein